MEPYRTLTAPAPSALPTASNGAPAARSAKPSSSKSPAAKAKPNRSPGLHRPADLGEQLPPSPGQPAGGEPYSTLTAPAPWRRSRLAGGPDGQVREPIVVEVPGGQLPAEAITTSGAAATWVNSWPAGPAQPTPGPIEDIDGPSVLVLAWDANRQIGEPVVVEISPHIGGCQARPMGQAGPPPDWPPPPAAKRTTRPMQSVASSSSPGRQRPTGARLAFVSAKASHSATNLASIQPITLPTDSLRR